MIGNGGNCGILRGALASHTTNKLGMLREPK